VAARAAQRACKPSEARHGCGRSGNACPNCPATTANRSRWRWPKPVPALVWIGCPGPKAPPRPSATRAPWSPRWA
jgi:hypothetical protein